MLTASVSPDYLLCPRSILEPFTKALKKAYVTNHALIMVLKGHSIDQQFPSGTSLSALQGEHYSPMHSQGAYDRLTEQLDAAEAEGRLIIKGERSPGNGTQGGGLGISVVLFDQGLNTSDTKVRAFLEDETFGPALVLVAVDVRGFHYCLLDSDCFTGYRRGYQACSAAAESPGAVRLLLIQEGP